jgi:hypothetical protein
MGKRDFQDRCQITKIERKHITEDDLPYPEKRIN